MIATSLLPLPVDTILPEICAFIIGFTYTVWTKMRSLAGSLTDGVLSDSNLSPPRPPIQPSNIRKGWGYQKKVRNIKPILVNEKSQSDSYAKIPV